MGPAHGPGPGNYHSQQQLRSQSVPIGPALEAPPPPRPFRRRRFRRRVPFRTWVPGGALSVCVCGRLQSESRSGQA